MTNVPKATAKSPWLYRYIAQLTHDEEIRRKALATANELEALMEAQEK